MTSYTSIVEVLTKKFDVKAEKISPQTTMDDLGLDSLSTAELIFEIGDKFDIDIPDERVNFTTLGEAAALVDELVQAKGA
jgi:acyl carrier protein